MNPTDNSHDDDQAIEALLASVGKDTVPPDPAFLQRLREQATEAFLAASGPATLPKKGRFMTARNLRVLAASVALVLIGAALYWYGRIQRRARLCPGPGQCRSRPHHLCPAHARRTDVRGLG